MAKKAKDKSSKKGFFKEFKEFISRGNVLDMAIGIIIGGAFTAIVNALSNNILKPIINWILASILGKDSLSEVYTFLVKRYAEDNVTIDLAQSIYIDWGAFINAIINFLLIALVLFLIIKTINSVHNAAKKAKEIADAKRVAQNAESEGAETVAAENAEEAVQEDTAEEPVQTPPVPAQETVAESVSESAPASPTLEELLTEIRDLLKEKPKKGKKE